MLALLGTGLYYRRREKKVWVAEERYEESGAWIDKRSGERGNYGSLDEEMEQERAYVSQQGRINDLALIIRNFAFEKIEGFSSRSDAALKAFSKQSRTLAADIIAGMVLVQSGATPKITPERSAVTRPEITALKKEVLQFGYQHFPEMLEAEIDAIKALDREVEGRLVTLLQ